MLAGFHIYPQIQFNYNIFWFHIVLLFAVTFHQFMRHCKMRWKNTTQRTSLYFPVQSQQKKHQKKVCNIFEVNDINFTNRNFGICMQFKVWFYKYFGIELLELLKSIFSEIRIINCECCLPFIYNNVFINKILMKGKL